MKFLFKINQEVLLVSAAVILLGILGGYFFWGLGDIISGVNQAVTIKTPTGNEVASFNIDGAAKLDYRGLLQP